MHIYLSRKNNGIEITLFGTRINLLIHVSDPGEAILLYRFVSAKKTISKEHLKATQPVPRCAHICISRVKVIAEVRIL